MLMEKVDELKRTLQDILPGVLQELFPEILRENLKDILPGVLRELFPGILRETLQNILPDVLEKILTDVQEKSARLLHVPKKTMWRQQLKPKFEGNLMCQTGKSIVP